MADPTDRIPTSRWARAARVGRLAATQGAKQALTRAANLARDERAADEALAKRQIEAAEQIVSVLGTMKGAAMKIGQTLSFLDVGLVPAEYREEFQLKLAQLRDAAPKVSFEEMRKVIEQEYERPLNEVFDSFDPVAIAAASIGQVYKARYKGRDVVVKVQYPGVAEAVRSDLKNLGLILRLLRSIAPGLDPQAMGDEIRNRIEEELDYELEAANQRALARVYRGHPFIVIPDVITSLSRERVIVSEYVSGRRFEEFKTWSDEERDRIGEIIFRFYFGSMYRHRQFSGDPHPGNCLLLDDGRMAFIDFGLFKRIPREVAEQELTTQRLGIEQRGAELIEHLHRTGWIGDPKRYTPEQILEQFYDLTGWYTLDAPMTLTPELATEVMFQVSDPRSQWWGRVRRETLPPDHLLGRRLEMLTLAVLGQLRATNNWHRIAREWIYGDDPVTELGRQEAEFLADRA
jgi:predicted unusual protein kinase regulating ubiquinone biosynthesis (AarF/ABC1/UbiB family)